MDILSNDKPGPICPECGKVMELDHVREGIARWSCECLTKSRCKTCGGTGGISAGGDLGDKGFVSDCPTCNTDHNADEVNDTTPKETT